MRNKILQIFFYNALSLLIFVETLVAVESQPIFNGKSSDLKTTKFCATLDEPIPIGENAVWCAAFLCAWKDLESNLVKEQISLEEPPEIITLLNTATNPRKHIPEDILFISAGWNDKGIIDRIKDGLKRKFPGAAMPSFPGILPDSFIAYAYLEANIKFSIPYFQNRNGMYFKDAAGKWINVTCFGIREKDEYAYDKLRDQPQIFFSDNKVDERRRINQCIIDLDRTSKPNQIILALIEPKPTLSEMIKTIEEKISIAEEKAGSNDEGLGPNDVLLVPDICFRVSHRFEELEGKKFKNVGMKGQRIDVAQEDIFFRLDRSGAELKSEAKSYCWPVPTHYVFNRPFLICMRKRGEKEPFFVMWIDNTELLKPWK